MKFNIFYYVIVLWCIKQASPLECYSGQHVIGEYAGMSQMPEMPMVLESCLDGTDVCMTVKYDLSIAVEGYTVNASATQGLCGSKALGCQAFCNALRNSLPMISTCDCCDTKECNYKLSKYVSAGKKIAMSNIITLIGLIVVVIQSIS